MKIQYLAALLASLLDLSKAQSSFSPARPPSKWVSGVRNAIAQWDHGIITGSTASTKQIARRQGNGNGPPHDGKGPPHGNPHGNGNGPPHGNPHGNGNGPPHGNPHGGGPGQGGPGHTTTTMNTLVSSNVGTDTSPSPTSTPSTMSTAVSTSQSGPPSPSSSSPGFPGVVGPCDIYASGGTPCVAAHGTTRALYGAYMGPLYDVIRGSDNLTIAITPITAGGVANARLQDEFCNRTTCLISMIYDQSGHGNHLRQAPSGGAAQGQENGFDFLASAVGAPVTLNGQKAYGVFIQPASGYRVDNTNGIAVGDEPEGIYGVLDGTHYNGACCFDYGNAETNNLDNGAGHMETIYFGNGKGYGTGSGNGPWILADLENELSSGQFSNVNPNDPTITDRFIHAVVKGNSSNHWAIRGGNAQSGPLNTFYSGPRPVGYYPMHKEGAIILGIGGDNSDGAQGTFYEGAMTQGYPANATEDAVQANIIAAKYATTSLTSGPPLTAGSNISVQAGYPSGSNMYMAHNGNTVYLADVTSASSTNLKEMATFTVTVGIGNSDCFSYECVGNPGSYVRHAAYQLRCDPNDGSMLFAGDSTFCPEAGLDGQGTSFRSFTYPTRYWRRYSGSVYIGQNGGPFAFDSSNGYNDQASWFVRSGFA